jgi:hypothetical protein
MPRVFAALSAYQSLELLLLPTAKPDSDTDLFDDDEDDDEERVSVPKAQPGLQKAVEPCSGPSS